jgi:hypothetical protein
MKEVCDADCAFVIVVIAQEYHNDLKRMGMSKTSISSLKMTDHDQAYYIDIVVGVAMCATIVIVFWFF